tara:strand:+ start:663 stop:932 length:270 start_codon:yes stop_codon:yes gene_type:complete
MSIRIFYPIFLLLIPLLGNVFSDEVNWTLFDFLVMGTILLTMGILINLIIDKLKKRSFKVLLIVVTLLVFALIYMELAVGIFGTPFAGS